MVPRSFWLARLQNVWKHVPVVWLAGVRRVGKTTLVQSLPAGTFSYINCDLPRSSQTLADPEFFFQQVREPMITSGARSILSSPAAAIGSTLMNANGVGSIQTRKTSRPFARFIPAEETAW